MDHKRIKTESRRCSIDLFGACSRKSEEGTMSRPACKRRSRSELSRFILLAAAAAAVGFGGFTKAETMGWAAPDIVFGEAQPWSNPNNWNNGSGGQHVPNNGDDIYVYANVDANTRGPHLDIDYFSPGLNSVRILGDSTGSIAFIGQDSHNLWSQSETISGHANHDQSGGENIVVGALQLDGGAPKGVNGHGGGYVISGNAVLSAGSISIASEQIGGMTQSDQSSVFTSQLNVGYFGSWGLYTLKGGQLTVNSTEAIGYAGTADFNQSGGRNAAGTVSVGNGPGERGTYTLTGGTLSGSSGLRLIVGDQGDGSFTQTGTNGSNVTATSVTIGNAAATQGVFTITAGSLNCSGNLNVGSAGFGTINQSGGTITIGSGSGLAIGNAAGAFGFYNLSGNGVLSPNLMFLGDAGYGFFTQSGGTISTSSAEFIGFIGAGSFNQTGGFHQVGGNLLLGYGAAGGGTYTISAGSMSVGASLSVGYDGLGKFSQTGGTVSFGSSGTPALIVGDASGSGTYSLSGGTLVISVPGTEGVGLFVGKSGAGTFNQSAGKATIDPYLYVGYNAGSTGTCLLSNTGSLSVFGYERVGFSGAGTFAQSGGNHAVNLGLALGYNAGGSGFYQLSGGSLGISGYLTIGVAGSATLNQSGGTFTVGSIQINNGVFAQSAGVGTVGGSVFVGDTSATIATASLSGSGSLYIGGDLTVSNNGAGTVTQAGNALLHVNGTIYNGGNHAGFYELDGGTIQAGYEQVGVFGPATFNQNGGLNTITNFLLIANHVSTAQYSLHNGTLITSGQLQNNGTFSQSGGVATIGIGTNGIVGNGTLIVSGGRLFTNSIRQNSITLSGSGTIVTVNSNEGTLGTSSVSFLSINTSSGARLDLMNHDMVVDYPAAGPSPIEAIRQLIRAAYNAGSWNLAGLTSSSAAADHRFALGYIEAASKFSSFPGTFSGLSVDSSSVLIKYTLRADSNLDGKVDLTDFTDLASNFNGTGKGWLQGDYSYDGNVDLTDFTLLASNFNQTLASDTATGVGGAVLEPFSSGVAFLVLGLAARLPRRLERI